MATRSGSWSAKSLKAKGNCDRAWLASAAGPPWHRLTGLPLAHDNSIMCARFTLYTPADLLAGPIELGNGRFRRQAFFDRRQLAGLHLLGKQRRIDEGLGASGDCAGE